MQRKFLGHVVRVAVAPVC